MQYFFMKALHALIWFVTSFYTTPFMSLTSSLVFATMFCCNIILGKIIQEHFNYFACCFIHFMTLKFT